MDRKSGSRKTVQDNSMIDQVMMRRFRPIAPKPLESDPDSGGSQLGNKGLLLSGVRTKRKYVRVRRAHKTNYTHRTKNRTSKKVPEEKKIVTLQLLPEKAEEGTPEIDKQGDDSENTLWRPISPNPRFPTHIKDIDHVKWTEPDWVHGTGSLSMDRMDPSDCIESCVMVETITAGSSTGAVGLGQTYMARLGPGFVSDPSGRVVWVNEAYEAMVSRQLMAMSRGGSLERWPEMVVRLVMKQGLLMPYWSGSFTSRVKIEYTWRCERWSQTVPCDVWRMENGGFAWRLDLDAALSLAIDTGSIKDKDNA